MGTHAYVIIRVPENPEDQDSLIVERAWLSFNGYPSGVGVALVHALHRAHQNTTPVGDIATDPELAAELVEEVDPDGGSDIDYYYTVVADPDREDLDGNAPYWGGDPTLHITGSGGFDATWTAECLPTDELLNQLARPRPEQD